MITESQPDPDLFGPCPVDDCQGTTDYDPGCGATWHEPEEPAAVYCPSCGESWPATDRHHRQLWKAHPDTLPPRYWRN